jgi:hypothetical protein
MDAGWERNLKWLAPSRQIAQRVVSESISIDRKTQSVCFTRNLGNGKSYSNWIYKGTALSPRGDNKNYYVSGVGVAPAVNFPELSWVNHKNFKGAGKFGERMVFVFRDAAKANTENKSSTKAEGFSEVEEAVEEEPVTSYRVDTKVAYLDAKTQMPVLSNDGNVIRIYSFSQPSGTLVPPKEMVEMLEKRQIEIQKRVALPGNPAG